MNLKIMIAEDDSIILDDLLSIIDWSACGFEVKSAVNGEQGLRAFSEFQPDIIITDIRMPFMSGLEMLEKISAIKKDVPCIVLSSYDDFEYARSAVKLGVKDYILKTELDGEMLLGRLNAIRAELIKSSPVYRYSPVINNSVKYISEHFKECDLRTEDIADAVHMSISRLSVRFKEETGQTMREYITLLRIQLAKELLLSGKYKIYEVAQMSGYSNSTYFSNLFREHTGVSPARYSNE